MNGYWEGRASRRRFLAAAAIGSGAAASLLAGCKGSNKQASPGSSGGAASAAIKPGLLPYSSATATAKNGRKGGTVITPWVGTTTLWDPYRASTNVVQHYSAIFDTLLQNEPKTLTYRPSLLQSWEEIETGVHYVFKLRPGITWENKPPTNGRAFDVDDVIYNIKYGSGMLTPSQKSQLSRADWYGNIASVTAPDKSTIDIKLASPNAAIFGVLADMRQFAIPREIPDSLSYNDSAKFPSCGPFLCKSYNDGESADYVRNPAYWDQPLPYVDNAKIKFFGDRASAAAALLTGEVNFWELRGKPEIAQILNSRQPVAVYPAPFRGHSVLYFNGQRYPDKRLWVALNLLYDKKANGDAVYGPDYWEYCGPIDRALPGATPVDKLAQLPGYNPATRDKDVKDAVAMLAASGHAEGEGIAITMLVGFPPGTGQEEALRLQAAVKQYAPKMKFDIRNTPDGSSFQRAIAVREYDMMAYSIYDAVDTRLAVSSWTTGHSRNYANYSNPEVDRLVAKSFAQPYQESLNTIKEIDKILLEGVPLIVPAGIVQTLGARTNIKGIEPRIGPGSPGPGNEVPYDRKYLWFEG